MGVEMTVSGQADVRDEQTKEGGAPVGCCFWLLPVLRHLLSCTSTRRWPFHWHLARLLEYELVSSLAATLSKCGEYS